MHSCVVVHAAVLFVYLIRCSREQQVPERSDFTETLDAVGYSLRELFHNATGYKQIIEWYNSSLDDGGTVVAVNGSAVLQEMFEIFSNGFDDLSRAITNLTNTSSELYSAHYNSSCCSEVCMEGTTSYNSSACWMACNATEVTNSYYRSAYNGGNLPPLEYSPIFDRDVNLDYSSVHIPVYVYEQKPSVLCFVEWTSDLLEHFQQQWQSLTDINHIVSYIYIGSEQSAATRIYPATERVVNRDCDRCPYAIVDTFDPKSRPWYIDTVVGEKHVVVLLDMSGSMMGLASDVARLAAIQLLNSLSNNDYFHVLRVDGNVSSFGDCLIGRTRASVENKLAMSRIISRTTNSYGIADFGTALDMAHGELINSSSCHKIIVVLTDRHSTLPVDHFNKMNNGTDIRVFGFVVGNAKRVEQIEKLSCANRGITIYINGYSSIVQGIQDFFSVLNQLHNQNTSDVFTHLYVDEFLTGLIMTMSQPVVVHLPDSSKTFLGVVGIDFVRESIEFAGNTVLLGSLGYAFGITNNGNLIFHPLTEKDMVQVQTGLVIFDVFYYEFLEPQEQFADVRKSFIDGDQGNITVISAIPVEGRIRYIVSNFTYYFTNIETRMAIVVKLPTADVYLLSSPPLNVSHLLELQSNLNSYPGEILVSIHRPYCNDWHQYTTDENSSARNALLRMIEEAIAVAEGNASSAECSARLYEPLLNDLYATSQIVRYWEDALSGNDSTVISVFAQFSSGLTWCLSNTLPCQPIYNISFVAMAEENGFDNISVFRGLSQSGLERTAILTRPINLPFAPSPSVGALGLVIETEEVDSILVNVINEASVEGSIIFLLDRSGYNVGNTLAVADSPATFTHDEFFGISPLFMDLLEENVYVERTVVGYDVRSCSVHGHGTPSESSGSLSTGILIILMSFSWHALMAVTALILQSLASLPFFLMSSLAMDSGSNVTDHCMELDLLLCVSQVHYYTAKPGLIPFTKHSFTCNKSEIEYQVGSVPGTSLVALKVFATSQQLELCSDNGVKHGEEEYILPCLCDNQLYHNSSQKSCPMAVTNYTLPKKCFTSDSHWTQACPYLTVPAIFISCLSALW